MRYYVSSPHLTLQHEHICDWCIVMCMGRPQPVTGNQSWTLWCDFFEINYPLLQNYFKYPQVPFSVLTSRISWCVNFGLEELLLELVDCLDVHLAEFLQSGRVKGKRRRCGVEGLTDKVFSRPFESQWKFESFRNWSRAGGLGSIVHDHACMQRMCNACVCVVLFIHCKKKLYLEQLYTRLETHPLDNWLNWSEHWCLSFTFPVMLEKEFISSLLWFRKPLRSYQHSLVSYKFLVSSKKNILKSEIIIN